MKFRKLTALLLAVVLMFSAFSVSAYAAEENTGEDITVNPRLSYINATFCTFDIADDGTMSFYVHVDGKPNVDKIRIKAYIQEHNYLTTAWTDIDSGTVLEAKQTSLTMNVPAYRTKAKNGIVYRLRVEARAYNMLLFETVKFESPYKTYWEPRSSSNPANS